MNALQWIGELVKDYKQYNATILDNFKKLLLKVQKKRSSIPRLKALFREMINNNGLAWRTSC